MIPAFSGNLNGFDHGVVQLLIIHYHLAYFFGMGKIRNLGKNC